MLLAPTDAFGGRAPAAHVLGGLDLDGGGHGLHDIVGVVVDFKRWLFYLLHLHVQLGG